MVFIVKFFMILKGLLSRGNFEPDNINQVNILIGKLQVLGGHNNNMAIEELKAFNKSEDKTILENILYFKSEMLSCNNKSRAFILNIVIDALYSKFQYDDNESLKCFKKPEYFTNMIMKSLVIFKLRVNGASKYNRTAANLLCHQFFDGNKHYYFYLKFTISRGTNNIDNRVGINIVKTWQSLI